MDEDMEHVITIGPTNEAENVHIDTEPVITIGPSPVTTIEIYLREKGWTKNKNGYSGPIIGLKGVYKGYLYNVGGGKLELFILNPPKCLFRGINSFCIQKKKNGWFWVHFNTASNPLEELFTLQDYLLRCEGYL